MTAAHLPYQRIAAGVQATLLPRPAALATAGRLLTLPGVERTLAEGWGLFWNELVDGAPPGKGRNTALAATKVGALLTSRTAARRWFDRLG